MPVHPKKNRYALFVGKELAFDYVTLHDPFSQSREFGCGEMNP